MTTPSDYYEDQSDLRQAHAQLREGLQTSREMVRQSRVLFELSESQAPLRAEDDDTAI